MSEMTAMRIRKAATLAVAGGVWCACELLLARTSVPSLDTSGLDVHRYFSQRSIDRAASYTRGADVLWLLSTAAMLAALVVLARVLPTRVRSIGLGRIGSAVIVGMVLIVGLWFVGLPFSFAELWWQHHWGLGPFDILAWLNGQWALLAPAALSALATIVLLVGLAGRFRSWWLVATPVVVVIAAFFAFVSGWLAAGASHPLRNAQLVSDAQRIERIEHVSGTPIRVQDVSKWTDQANAFTVGFGPSTHVVLWDTLLGDRFTRGEKVAVIAPQLGPVGSRPIIKSIGWAARLGLPAPLLPPPAPPPAGGGGGTPHPPPLN